MATVDWLDDIALDLGHFSMKEESRKKPGKWQLKRIIYRLWIQENAILISTVFSSLKYSRYINLYLKGGEASGLKVINYIVCLELRRGVK